MISRRNIRVKVMQTLYTLLATHSDERDKAAAAGQRILNDKLNQSLDLFATVVTYLTSVAQYAETDARVRASKYLPTEADKNVNTKIAGNEMIWLTLENDTYREKLNQANIADKIDQDQVKKVYQTLVQTPEYEAYCADNQRDAKSEKAIIRFIWTELMVKSEDFQGFLMDEIAGWEDDKDMIFILMDNFFKNSSNINYLALISGEKLEFARNLLSTAIEKEEYCMELIRPKLINWEAERVAQIDLILLRLGICELLYFPTIPTKVTINEYIEIAKQYSTPQSGHFVNAVLDRLLKDFEQEKKIRKQDRPVR
ncbi:transcription antitermination factor NusB [Rurimicrobium arvi]|uniref:Transcription antitermination factor NusB n=1 Tax=Rurimicrobium arvi TaxID=2049916 RepID=A0ABP8N1C7_9BACT